MKIKTTPYEIASRFIGMKEVPGSVANPQILAMLKLDNKWPDDDSVPWCSGFVNYIAFLLGLPRSKSLMARSWLKVGDPVCIDSAEKGFDIVILKRGYGNQPGPDVLNAPGHVGWFSGFECQNVNLLGGNQKDMVNVSGYNKSRILGIRRLSPVNFYLPRKPNLQNT